MKTRHFTITYSGERLFFLGRKSSAYFVDEHKSFLGFKWDVRLTRRPVKWEEAMRITHTIIPKGGMSTTKFTLIVVSAYAAALTIAGVATYLLTN